MQDFLTSAEFAVERDRRGVDIICLHEYGGCAALGGCPAQTLEQLRGDASPTEWLGDGEIVDVDLAALPFEFAQLVCDQAADDFRVHERHQDDDPWIGEELADIAVVRGLGAVSLGIVECLTEY